MQTISRFFKSENGFDFNFSLALNSPDSLVAFRHVLYPFGINIKVAHTYNPTGINYQGRGDTELSTHVDVHLCKVDCKVTDVEKNT